MYNHESVDNQNKQYQNNLTWIYVHRMVDQMKQLTQDTADAQIKAYEQHKLNSVNQGSAAYGSGPTCGFDKTWNLNLYLIIIITVEISTI